MKIHRRRCLRLGLLIVISAAVVAPLGTVTRAQTASGADNIDGSQANPVEEIIFDNWNVEACAFTNESKFALASPTRLTSIELWYNWQKSEATLAFQLLSHGDVIARGTLSRGGCDPYQTAWCAATASLDLDAQPGAFSVRVPRGRLCMNATSQGNGMVRVKGQRPPNQTE